jgi:hypothetical protein
VTDRHSGRNLSKNLKIRIYKTVILSVVMYGCEQGVEGKRDGGTGSWGQLHNAELRMISNTHD